jgi:WD40 repeat protein
VQLLHRDLQLSLEAKCVIHPYVCAHWLKRGCPQDCKVYLNEWDGKVLNEIGVLEGNTGIVSALAFSPDGKLLASGDVSMLYDSLVTSLTFYTVKR